jgi:UPF0716 protein FxsA
MSFIALFFIAILSLSYFELIMLVEVSSQFGFLATLLFCFVTAIVGGGLVRSEGMSVLSELQGKLAKGEDPSGTVVGAVLLFISGILLLVPGFITDTFGFLCLIKPFRESVGKAIFEKIKSRISLSRNRPGQGSSSKFHFYTNINVNPNEGFDFKSQKIRKNKQEQSISSNEIDEDKVIDVQFTDAKKH